MSTSYSPKIVTDGLVLYLDAANNKSYPRSGTDWIDLTNSNFTGSIIGTGISFNTSSNSLGSIQSTGGTGNSVLLFDISNKTDFTITNNYTIVCWANVSSSQNYGVYTFKPIIDKDGREGGVRAHPYSMVHISASNVIRSSVGNGTLNNAVEVPFELNKWKMITSVYSWSTTQLTVYVNEIQNSGSLNLSGNIGNTVELQLLRNNGITNFTAGNIATMAIYNKALSPDEVLQNLNATRGRFGV